MQIGLEDRQQTGMGWVVQSDSVLGQGFGLQKSGISIPGDPQFDEAFERNPEIRNKIKLQSWKKIPYESDVVPGDRHS